jgi:hypothetical protein
MFACHGIQFAKVEKRLFDSQLIEQTAILWHKAKLFQANPVKIFA